MRSCKRAMSKAWRASSSTSTRAFCLNNCTPPMALRACVCLGQSTSPNLLWSRWRSSLAFSSATFPSSEPPQPRNPIPHPAILLSFSAVSSASLCRSQRRMPRHVSASPASKVSLWGSTSPPATSLYPLYKRACWTACRTVCWMQRGNNRQRVRRGGSPRMGRRRVVRPRSSSTQPCGSPAHLAWRKPRPLSTMCARRIAWDRVSLPQCSGERSSGGSARMVSTPSRRSQVASQVANSLGAGAVTVGLRAHRRHRASAGWGNEERLPWHCGDQRSSPCVSLTRKRCCSQHLTLRFATNQKSCVISSRCL
mmetsp:Transcript_4879/g.11709  ORF Transcript_4879/g.11709 Transcript_4879/m.11709 type:complete len:309 (+) Transcript_4879:798-1724(+)